MLKKSMAEDSSQSKNGFIIALHLDIQNIVGTLLLPSLSNLSTTSKSFEEDRQRFTHAFEALFSGNGYNEFLNIVHSWRHHDRAQSELALAYPALARRVVIDAALRLNIRQVHQFMQEVAPQNTEIAIATLKYFTEIWGIESMINKCMVYVIALEGSSSWELHSEALDRIKKLLYHQFDQTEDGMRRLGPLLQRISKARQPKTTQRASPSQMDDVIAMSGWFLLADVYVSTEWNREETQENLEDRERKQEAIMSWGQRMLTLLGTSQVHTLECI